jgi:ABC-type transport system involved in cytochrome bd biosynthesis fused ATPase/permease subunit
MKLFNIQFNILTSDLSTVYFILEICISALLPNIRSWMKTDETALYVAIYVIVLIVKEIISMKYHKIVKYISLEKQKKFHLQALEKYKTLSQFDRESESIHVFLDTLNGMKYVIGLECTWIKTTCKNIISLITTTITTLYIVKSIEPLLYIFICYASVYVFIKSHMKNMETDRKNNKEISKRIEQQNRFEYSKIRLGDGNINDIVNRKNIQEMNYIKCDTNWLIMNLYTSLPLLCALLLSVFTNVYIKHNDYTYSLELIMFFLTLDSNMYYITSFMSNIERIKLKTDKYNDYWRGKTFTPLPQQHDIDEYIISDYTYNGNKLNIKGIAQINNSQIIRLTGATGSGKTTFIDSIKGVVPGITLNNGMNPMCFLNNISHMRQDIRDSIPFNDISIKDLFNDYDDEGIKDILCVVGLNKWLTYTMNNDLSKQIQNNISGGQKTLFCLALSLIDAVDKQMLILDEPEQGLDMELIPNMLTNVFEWIITKNPGLRIIFISHLCECVVSKLPKHSHWHIIRDDNEYTMTIN